MTTEDTRKTTETSFTVLEAIDELGGATLSELAEHTGLATSTLYTHLRTLTESEYAVEEDGVYKPGLKLFHLGEKARHRDERYEFAKRTASELATQVNEEVNFAVEEYGRAVILFDETTSPASEGFQVGKYFHMHSSASGKAMLAEYPENRVREILDRHGLPALTDRTITDEEELFAELERVREQGYAVNAGEELEGLQAVAIAVHEPDGSVFGTLDISGPPYRLPENDRIAAQLRPFVEELEGRLREYERDDG